MLRLTPRVKNALQLTLGRDRADDIDYLGSLEPETIKDLRALGARGTFDLAVSLIASRPSQPDEIWPKWLVQIGPKLKPEPQYEDDPQAEKEGMTRLTDRFGKKEWYELMRCCADLHRGGIEWALMSYGDYADRGLAVARSSNGMREVAPEEASE